MGWKEKISTIEVQMKWAVLFALVLASLTALRDAASMDDTGQVEVWVWSLASQLTLFLYWAFCTPVVLNLMDRMRRNAYSRLRIIGLHLGTYAVLGSIFYGFVVLVNVKLWPMYGKTASWDYLYHRRAVTAILLNSFLKYYLPILLGGALYAYYRGMRAEELKAAQLKEQLADSQFRLLKMQLHPHFLFNALHSISTLTYTDPARADGMIAQLSDLLRMALESSDVITVPLQEELQYVTKYLEIERIRFSDRLTTKFSIEQGALSAPVPNLILQPLVENAIKHGTSKVAEGGVIHIKACRQRGGLVLAVEDNGPGFNKKRAPGVGTSNVRERLRRLYSHQAHLKLENLQPQGARQELFIPLDDVAALFEARTVEYGAVS